MKRPALAIVKDDAIEERIAALEHDYGVLVGTVQQMQKEIRELERQIKDINHRESV